MINGCAVTVSIYLHNIPPKTFLSHPNPTSRGFRDLHTLQNTSFPKIYTFPYHWNLVDIYHRQSSCSLSLLFYFWLKRVLVFNRCNLEVFTLENKDFQAFTCKKIKWCSVSTFNINYYILHPETEPYSVKCKSYSSEIVFYNQLKRYMRSQNSEGSILCTCMYHPVIIIISTWSEFQASMTFILEHVQVPPIQRMSSREFISQQQPFQSISLQCISEGPPVSSLLNVSILFQKDNMLKGYNIKQKMHTMTRVQHVLLNCF